MPRRQLKKVAKNIYRLGEMHRYDKTVRGTRLTSLLIYPNIRSAQDALAKAVALFLETGRILTDSAPTSPDTVQGLLVKRLEFLMHHGSSKHYSDMRTALPRWLAYAPHLASAPVTSITTEDCTAWLEAINKDMLARGRDRGKEANKASKYLQAAWNHPWEDERLPRTYQNNPWRFTRRFPVERSAKYVPRREEVAAILVAAPPEFKLFLRILHETGARPIEARTLAWENIGAETITLGSRKSARGDLLPRRLIVPEELTTDLESWRKRQPAGAVYVFQQEAGGPPRVKTWDRRQHLAACQRAGVEYFPCTCYRNFYAFELDRAGHTLTYIRDRLGHSKATTTDIYLRQLRGV